VKNEAHISCAKGIRVKTVEWEIKWEKTDEYVSKLRSGSVGDSAELFYYLRVSLMRLLR